MPKPLLSVSVDQFFDRAKVMSRVDRSTLRFLRRSGGLVRIIARRSIRKRKKISEPGKPPNSHEGTLRKGIFFGLEPNRETVVIGPAPAFRQTTGGGQLRGASLLEHGGATIGTDSKGKRRRMVYRARPFMGPALETAEPDLAGFLKDSVK